MNMDDPFTFTVPDLKTQERIRADKRKRASALLEQSMQTPGEMVGGYYVGKNPLLNAGEALVGGLNANALDTEEQQQARELQSIRSELLRRMPSGMTQQTRELAGPATPEGGPLMGTATVPEDARTYAGKMQKWGMQAGQVPGMEHLAQVAGTEAMTAPRRQAEAEAKAAEHKETLRQTIAGNLEKERERQAWQGGQNDLTRAAQAEARADRNATRAAAAAQNADGKATREQQANWRFEDALSKQFDTQARATVEELTATQKVKQLAPTILGRRPNAIEQQTLAVLLNKFLDPESVVREGEFDRVARAQGLYDKATNLQNRILSGEPMSDKLIAEIVGMSDFYEKAARGKMQSIGDLYTEKAKKRGLDPDAVVVSPYYKRGGVAPTPATVVRTGTHNGRKVEQLSDGTTRYVN
jgi:hypothetical protein